MRVPPESLNKIHFVGIGGIGMSGIAEILHTLGYHVQGSDAHESVNVERLRSLGISVVHGHEATSVENVSVVVVSSAVKDDNPEVIEARARSIPVIQRADMLAEIMNFKFSVAIAGTHGKTTTTSMNATVLDAGGFDPIVINGGIINAYGTNARLGKGDWCVAEADESDGSFLKIPRTIAVVTNIDPEHMEYYENFQNLEKAFWDFIHGIPFYGLAVLCKDHPVVSRLAHSIQDRRVVTYGFHPEADIRAINVVSQPHGSFFDIVLSEKGREILKNCGDCSSIKNLFLSMVGEHNVQNALSTIAIALELGIEEAALKQALKSFQGVKRRFTEVAEVNGIKIIDDYAHHPIEIGAVLKTARSITTGRVIAVFQPHRYSRVKNLLADFAACFKNADAVIVTPIYSAGEEPIEGISQEAVIKEIRNIFHGDVFSVKNAMEIGELVEKYATAGDYVICLGAGSITVWAGEISEFLSNHQNVMAKAV